MTTLPAIFVSHGAPTLALQPGKTGAALEKLGKSLPRPSDILVISAHWNTPQPTLSSVEHPDTIHDFYGFPDELYRLRYPAPGAPDLAQHAKQLLDGAGFTAGVDALRGLDHGAWVPLRIMYPQADIPVTQLSVQAARNPAHHYRVGLALTPLREQGTLILASGSFTHNLYEIAGRAHDSPVEPYTEEFTHWMAERIERNDVEELLRYRQLAPHAARAHPTDEHLLPLFVALGAAHEEKQSARVNPETTYGILAMDAFVLGAAHA